MADYERTVLEHYQLPTAYPTEWPEEKDQSDISDDEDDFGPPRALMGRRKSVYQALEQVATDRRSFVPGAQKTGDGVENLVQKDESDPLGSTESVVRILRSQGLPVDDIKLRQFPKS
jgi:exocyst complex component 2